MKKLTNTLTARGNLFIAMTLGVFLGLFFYAETLPVAQCANQGTASLQIVPVSQVGNTLKTEVRIDVQGKAASGIEGFIQYSDNLVFLESNDTNSVMDQEIIPAQKKEDGLIELVRMRFDKGFSGEDGYVIGLTFQITSPGETFVQIETQKSRVIAFEDSSDILQSAHGISANITEVQDTQGQEGAAPSEEEWVVMNEEVEQQQPQKAEEINWDGSEEEETVSASETVTSDEEQTIAIPTAYIPFFAIPILVLVAMIAVFMLLRKKGGTAAP